jgi:uncharacterized membrane protein YeaQ/YmgE (transglycosylase-associated protein family)
MGLLSWIIVGGLAGLLAQFLTGEGGAGCIVTVLIGVVGALVGGFVMGLFGYGGVNGIDIWSIVVATLGAVIVLVVARFLRRA